MHLKLLWQKLFAVETSFCRALNTYLFAGLTHTPVRVCGKSYIKIDTHSDGSSKTTFLDVLKVVRSSYIRSYLEVDFLNDANTYSMGYGSKMTLPFLIFQPSSASWAERGNLSPSLTGHLSARQRRQCAAAMSELAPAERDGGEAKHKQAPRLALVSHS